MRVSRLALAFTLLACLALLPGAASAEDSGPLAGRLFDETFYSPILGREMPYRVYLPPDYYGGSRRYPVMYMLHGAGGDHWEWSYSFLPERADEMIKGGEIQPMIIVMPSGVAVDGSSRTYWVNWADDGPRWEDYVVTDVVGTVDQRFRTLPSASSRSIGGLSMGGYGALDLGLRNPDVFGTIGAHSPSIRTAPDADLWFLPGERFWEYDPATLVETRPSAARQLSIWIDIGLDDWWRPNLDGLRNALVRQAIPFTYRVLPGTHEADYWIENVPRYLRFYSASLRGDEAAG